MKVAKRGIVLTSLALASLVVSCGGSKPYLDAVTTFAGNTADGVTSLGGLPATAASVCRKRAVARFLKRHLPEQGSVATWEEYYTTPKEADGNLSWKEYCADIQASSANFRALMTILSDYAKAMKELAAAGAWDGSPLGTALSNAGNLVGAKTAPGTVLSALGAPVKQLGSVVAAKYTADKAHEFAIAADRPVQAILDGLDSYLVAVKRDVVDPSRDERVEVVGLLEKKANVWTPAPEASRIVSFATYAQSVDDDLGAIDAQIAGYNALIVKLKSGHAELVKVRQDDSGAKDIALAATEILDALTQVEAAVAGK